MPIDRWDPVAARVGDAWDTLLHDGLDVWAAYAPSDFHTESLADLGDYWPGQFAETWVYAPERSSAGILRALHAGSFFGDHGRIVREAELHVGATGLARPAGAGEVISVPKTHRGDGRLVDQGSGGSVAARPQSRRSGRDHRDRSERCQRHRTGTSRGNRSSDCEDGSGS